MLQARGVMWGEWTTRDASTARGPVTTVLVFMGHRTSAAAASVVTSMASALAHDVFAHGARRRRRDIP